MRMPEVVEAEQGLLLVPHGPLQVVDVGVGDHVGARAGHQAQRGAPGLPCRQSQTGGGRTGGDGRGRRRGEADRVVVVIIIVVVGGGQPRLRATRALLFTLSVIAR